MTKVSTVNQLRKFLTSKGLKGHTKWNKQELLHEARRFGYTNQPFFIVDVETNGIGTFRPPTQRPIQISYQLINECGKLITSESKFIRGVKEINWPANFKECPWTVDEINSNGISVEELYSELNSLLTNDITIVGHNIEFDIGAICNLINDDDFTKKIKKMKKLCTMKLSTNFCKLMPYIHNNYKWPKLSELAVKLNITTHQDKFHDSKYDVEITKQCLLKLIKNNVI